MIVVEINRFYCVYVNRIGVRFFIFALEISQWISFSRLYKAQKSFRTHDREKVPDLRLLPMGRVFEELRIGEIMI